MRVIYFSADYTTHDWRYLAKLAETDHQVWYLRLSRGPIALEKRSIPLGIELVEWAGGQRPVQGLVNQLRLLPSLRRVVRQLRPDLIHAGPIQSCGFLAALTKFRPLLLMSWGSDVLVDADRGPLWRWVTRFTFRHADAVVGDCRAVRERIRQLTGYPDDKIVTFPWGIDLGAFSPGTTGLNLRERLGWEDKTVILSTRSWEKLYGIDVLLNAFAEVAKEFPESRLLLLGDGSMAQEVHCLISDNGLSDAVHLTGQVPHESLADYFNLADIYVSSSFSDGSSVSLLEAMACALPVVVTDIPGNREWVTPGINGWLAKAGDVSSLASALSQSLADSHRWTQMGEANLGIVRERADWNKNFQVLLSTYDRVAVATGHG